jgi:hypothetical protein
MLEREGMSGMLRVAHRVGRVAFGRDEPDTLFANFAGACEFARTELAVLGDGYSVVSYGESRELLSLGGIVERLLENDVQTLEAQIALFAGEPWYSRDWRPAIAALQPVIASEVNRDVFVALSKLPRRKAGAARAAGNDLLSNEFAERMTRAARTCWRVAWRRHQVKILPVVLGSIAASAAVAALTSARESSVWVASIAAFFVVLTAARLRLRRVASKTLGLDGAGATRIAVLGELHAGGLGCLAFLLKLAWTGLVVAAGLELQRICH